MFDKILALVGIAIFIFAIFSSVQYVNETYGVTLATDSWINQAAAAPTADQKAMYLKKAYDGYEKYNLTQGYDEWWYPTPDNDMTVKMQQLNDTIKYADQVNKINKDSFNAYSSAFDILEGKINNLGINSVGAYLVHTNQPLWGLSIIAEFVAAFLLGGIGISMCLSRRDSY
jgi:hypothetical protein